MSRNKISELDTSKLPKQLIELDVKNNSITKLPDLSCFAEMTSLSYDVSKITKIERLPPKLERLDFSW